MTTRLEELCRIARLERRTIVGLMSGTSLDGVDAALCRVSGSGRDTRVVCEAFETYPLPADVRGRVLDALEGAPAEELCQLGFLLGEVFADAALGVATQAGLPIEAVDVVASHGQTIWHVDRTQGGVPSTLQLGEGAVIAARTGRVVVCDFRPADIAAGGRGAPLVAYVDRCLCAPPGRSVALQNVGGMANVTVVPADPEAPVLAFDTGPGNVLIDEVCRELTEDDEAFDRDGAFSRLGEVDPELLSELLAHDYLGHAPPKTTGREVFGVPFAQGLVARYDRERLIDLLATVVRFVATSIADAYRRFVLPRSGLDEVVVSGGGARNRTLMAALGEELPGLPVRTFDTLELGFGSEAKEAVAFAVLANETIQGRPSNEPAATGADRPAVLGKIVL